MSPLKNKIKEKDIFFLFKGGMFLKGIHAIIEIMGGFLALFLTQNFIIQSILTITQDELSEDPKDFLANYVIHASQSFSISSQHFVAFYLLSHGIIKGILVINLLQKKRWAYPTSLVVFSAFVIYQIIRYTYTHSVWLIVFTLFDLIVIWLIWHEYKMRDEIGRLP